jgi:hypothetical protein
MMTPESILACRLLFLPDDGFRKVNHFDSLAGLPGKMALKNTGAHVNYDGYPFGVLIPNLRSVNVLD